MNLVRTPVINNAATAALTQIQTHIFNEKFVTIRWKIVNIPLDRRENPAHGVNRLVFKQINKISLIVVYPDKRNIYI